MMKETRISPRSTRILIIEDVPAILEALRLLLEEEGYEVATTENGGLVEHLMHEWQPDLVLLDLWLPGISGQEICQHIKKLEALSRVPLLLMSAGHDLAYRAKQACADGYLKKPFTMQVLFSTITQALHEPPPD
jgi:DNA-binding response OmpR family regulator